MSSNRSNTEVKAIGNFLNLKNLKCVVDKKSGVAQLKHNGQTVSGLASIATFLGESAHESPINGGGSDINRAQVQQWLEYRVSVIDRCLNEKDITTVLKELNAFLQHRVYFVGSSLSLADLIIYFGLHSTLNQLSLQEKEGYLHLSRWFNNVQRVANLVSFYPTLPFSLNYLYHGVTSH